MIDVPNEGRYSGDAIRFNTTGLHNKHVFDESAYGSRDFKIFDYSNLISISTLLFFCLPASVSFVAIGLDSPK